MAKPISAAGPDIAGRMVKFAKAIEGASVDTVKAAAEAAKAEQLKRMRADSGGDLRLSGVNRRKGRAGNTRIGVSYRVRKASGVGVGATALVRATGPLQIINNDTTGRVIRSAYSRNTRRAKRIKGSSARGFIGPVLPGQFDGGRKAVLNIPGIGYRRSVRHPGTKGKQTWQLGRRDAEPKIRERMGKRTTAVIARGMKG